MKGIKNVMDIMTNARQQEQEGNLNAAAALYQRVVDEDPANREAVRRLLTVYRRLKDYSRELEVVDAALDSVARRDKTTRKEWLAAHPAAAKLGKAMLRTLGGEQVTAYGTDPFVEQLQRRKGLLERKISGVKHKKKGQAPVKGKRQKERSAESKPQRAEAKQQKPDTGKEKERAAAVQRKKKIEARRVAREAAAERRQQAAQARKEEREAAKARETERKAATEQKNAPPSLFVISLHYLVPLEKIDAAMTKHMAFLDKYFASGVFMVAGRQVPRTGGVILARGKDRNALERIMKLDPFIRGKLATVDIVEFKAIMTAMGLRGWIK
ncbi:MAG TPA: YciI family protein [Puia sp.]